ncbi:MAG TPA: hypothetical protein VFW50_29705 [Streptosporangiaceae bacterium]|nr:hypothetical protein [Streptosporangiaceae bacterium]
MPVTPGDTDRHDGDRRGADQHGGADPGGHGEVPLPSRVTVDALHRLRLPWYSVPVSSVPVSSVPVSSVAVSSVAVTRKHGGHRGRRRKDEPNGWA